MDRGVDQWSTAGTLSVGDRTLKNSKLSVEELGVLNSTEPRLRTKVTTSVTQQPISIFPVIHLGNMPMDVVKHTHYTVLAKSQCNL